MIVARNFINFYRFSSQLIKNNLFISSCLTKKTISLFSTTSSAQQTQNTKQNRQKSQPDNHFGFKNVATQEKQSLVNQVFHSVANKYDVMNDVMSMGVHRIWKNYFVNQLGNLNPKVYTHQNINSAPTRRVLDVAGGTGDISYRILENHNHKNLKCTVLDINQSMLDQGKKRAQQMGLKQSQIQFICANAQQLPFESNTFDAYTISFGLRNVPRTKVALSEAFRVLKPGGRFMCLQFSKVQHPILRQIYRQYSFRVIPTMGQIITNDKDSYQYLVESIQRFLSQQKLLYLMEQVGFKQCKFQNLTDGIVAIHSGFKL